MTKVNSVLLWFLFVLALLAAIMLPPVVRLFGLAGAVKLWKVKPDGTGPADLAAKNLSATLDQ